MRRDRCDHGFSEPALCPVCLHFDKIAQAEAAAQERAAVAPPAAAEPSEGLDDVVAGLGHA
jgi:hypothetical protein